MLIVMYVVFNRLLRKNRMTSETGKEKLNHMKPAKVVIISPIKILNFYVLRIFQLTLNN